MSENLIVPAEIETVIQSFEKSASPFTELSVQAKLSEARKSLKGPNESENLGAWAEVLAFALVSQRHGESPWNTYFGPIGSGTKDDGQPFYSPDIKGTPAQVLSHWAKRAAALQHPLLKSRYADLVWDMAPAIGNERRNPEMARTAIDAYLASVAPDFREEPHDRFNAAIRALDLACIINDAARIEQARKSLMDLHRESISRKECLWWIAFDRLVGDKKSGVTEGEINELVASLETLIAGFSNSATSDSFDPHSTESAAKRLIGHYTRIQKPDDVKRLHTVVAKAFEHFASLASPMLAASVLQTSVDAYRNAGLAEDSRRVRILMQQKIGDARDEMAPIGSEVQISKDDIEKFLASIVLEDLGQTFVRLAVEFLPRRKHLEEQVQKTLEQAPLMAHISQHIMADDHVVAIIGSVEDDPFGRLVHQTMFSFSFSALWLEVAFSRTFDKHPIVPEHIVGWANRHGLFDDMGLLLEGVRAWFEGDYVKTLHVLVPQVECGLRAIVASINKPVTKAHPKVQGASVIIGMGDILYNTEITDVLGPDLSLYFLSLYADPRALNLRNEIAHGLLDRPANTAHLARLVIHTLLVLGLWKEFAERGR